MTGAAPEDLRFSKEHLWVRVEGERVRLGVTDRLVDSLGRVIDVDLPTDGQEADVTSEIGTVTGSKGGAVPIFSPVAGTVSEVNRDLEDDPELVSSDPYDEGWCCILTGVDADDIEALMGPEEYEAAADEEEA